MESFIRLAAVLLLTLCAINYVWGCTCARSHPQQSYCKKGRFGALVKVRSADFVYIMERPKVHKDKSQNSTDEQSTDNVAVVNKRDETLEPKEEMERVEVVVKERDLYKMLHSQFIVSYIRYRVKVYETYNGLKLEDQEGKKVYIYTAPYGSVCGITLQEKETYLLIGSIGEDERLSIGLCDYHVHWNPLKSKQRKAIKRNMRAAEETCRSNCTVSFCDSNWEKCHPNKDTCLWTEKMLRASYKFKVNPVNYACKRETGKQDAQCTWNEGLADTKRGRRLRRRRRRNHTSGFRLRHKKSPTVP